MPPYQHPGPDDPVFLRWMQLELGKMNAGLVAEKKTLASLLLEEKPSAATKSGELYLFDKKVLAALREALPEELHRKLRLPIQFRFDADAGASGYLTDPHAAEALVLLGEISHLREFTDNRLWVSRPIIYAIMRKYPTAIQVAMG